MNNSPRFAFLGTPDFSVRILNILEEHGLLPVLAVTAPDKPRGRGQKLQPTAVKVWADKRDIPVLTPSRLQGDEFLSAVASYDLDCSVVAAYGLIMPDSILSLPRFGSINVHPSILPKYRGASPIESQVLADEDDIGVTIMQMDEKMDHGPILSQQSITRPQLLPDAPALEKVLAQLGGELLSETMVAYVSGEIEPEAQDHDAATYTKKITKEDTLIDLADEPYQNFLKIRAYKRFRPHFFAERDEKKIRVVITKADFNKKDHTLSIERVIPEGGSEMAFIDFLKKTKLI